VASGFLVLAYLVPWAFGLACYLWLRRVPTRIEALAVSWAIGWASINVVSILTNEFSRIAANEGFFGIISAFLSAASGLLLYRHRRKVRALLRGPLIPAWFRGGLGATILTVFGAFLFLVFYQAAIIPPVSTDAIVYHMRIPLIAWQTGYIPMNPGLGWLELANTFPNLLETQQLWIYLGANEASEVFMRPIMPIYTSLLLLIVLSDTRRWFGLPSAALATAALFSLNEFSSLTNVIWAEIPVAFFSYLAVRTIASERGIRSSAAAGAFAGMAALTKYNGLVLLAAVALASAMFALHLSSSMRSGRRISRLTASLTELGVVTLTGLLVASPLLLRNLYFFGNPIYPFIWGGVNTEQVSYYFVDYSFNDYLRFRIDETIILLASVISFGFALGLLRHRSWFQPEAALFLTSSLYLVMFLYSTFAGSHVRYLAPIIPAASAFCGRQLWWFIREADIRRKAIGAAVLVTLAASVVGLLLVVDVRPDYLLQYVGTFLVGGAVVLALAILRGSKTNKRIEKVTAALVAVALISPGIFAVAAARFPPRETALDVNLVPQDPESFLAGQFGDDWRMWQWINANLPLDTVLLTFEARLFYLERTVIFGADHVLLPTYSMSLIEAVAFVRNLGIRDILDSPWSHNPDVNRIFWQRSVIFQNLDNRSFFQPIHFEGRTVLYAVVP